MSAARTGSLHDRYRERLAVLATDVAPVAAIVESGGWSGPGASDRHWIRTNARFAPEKEPFVTMVFETDVEPQQICQLDVFATRPAHADVSAWVVEHAEGWVRVTPFPCDAALPTLAAVLASPGRRTVVRYRPRSRCTIRFESAGGRVRFAKVFSDDAGKLSHANGCLLWRAARRSELDFAVARPERWDPVMRTLWQEGIPGTALTALHLDAAGAGLAQSMGRAAASLTRSLVRPFVVYDWVAHFARSVRYAVDLGARVPRLAGLLDTLLRELKQAHGSVKAKTKWPIHGSLSRTQWIDGTSRLGLVDFDKLAFGDPEFDVAAFLTEL